MAVRSNGLSNANSNTGRKRLSQSIYHRPNHLRYVAMARAHTVKTWYVYMVAAEKVTPNFLFEAAGTGNAYGFTDGLKDWMNEGCEYYLDISYREQPC